MYEITVEWQTDGEDVDLPVTVHLPDDMDPKDEEEVCEWLSATYGWLVEGYSYQSDDDYYDDSMDGDHASALASCGWGTDEDYGHFDDYGEW
jgi:hypothetical protein